VQLYTGRLHCDRAWVARLRRADTQGVAARRAGHGGRTGGHAVRPRRRRQHEQPRRQPRAQRRGRRRGGGGHVRVARAGARRAQRVARAAGAADAGAAPAPQPQPEPELLAVCPAGQELPAGRPGYDGGGDVAAPVTGALRGRPGAQHGACSMLTEATRVPWQYGGAQVRRARARAEAGGHPDKHCRRVQHACQSNGCAVASLRRECGVRMRRSGRPS